MSIICIIALSQNRFKIYSLCRYKAAGTATSRSCRSAPGRPAPDYDKENSIEKAAVTPDGNRFITVPCFARRMAEGIPDGQSPAILLHCALDLIGCGCRAPDEIFRK